MLSRTSLLVALASYTLCAANAAAQPTLPFVVRDLYLPTPVGGGAASSSPGPMITVAGLGYFAATDLNGRELWVTDGTHAGTRLVRDIRPGTESSDPQHFQVINGQVYFTADDGQLGRELWVTDGTSLGTRLVGDYKAGPLSASPFSLAQMGTSGRIAITGNVDVPGVFYIYDGTSLAALDPRLPCCTQSGACTMMFRAECQSASGIAGQAGTTCATMSCSPYLPVSCCMPSGACFYLNAIDCVAQGGVPNAPNTVCGNCVVPATWVASCCFTNGTCTVVTKSSCQTAGGSARTPLACTPTNCNFTTYTVRCCLSSGQCLSLPSAGDCAAFGGTALPVGQTCSTATCPPPSLACCRLDGTCSVVSVTVCRTTKGFMLPMGTSCSPGLCAAPAALSEAPQVRGQLITVPTGIWFFALQSGRQFLYHSNGSWSDTYPLVELPSQATLTNSFSPIFVGDKLFFSLSVPTTGNELWVTDGTAAGTHIVKDLLAGPDDGLGDSPISTVEPVAHNGELYFLGTMPSGAIEVFKTDGTDTGTIQLSALPTGRGPTDLTVGDQGVYFAAQIMINSDNRTWYHTDGTPAGTVLVGPIQSGTSIPSPAAQRLFAGGKLYYAGPRVGTGFRAVWTLNLSGFEQVYPPPGTPIDAANHYDFDPANFVWLDDRVFFAGSNTPPSNATGRELWSTDGTSTGTAIVRDIAQLAPSNVSWLAEGPDGDLYFPAATPATGIELFRTSGGPGTTQIVADLMPGSSSSNPTNPAYLNGSLVFNATIPGLLRAACRSDGTPQGTASIGTTVPGPGPLNTVRRFFPFAGRLYFVANRDTTGLELWSTDGTAAGTLMLPELWPGPASGLSLRPNFTVYNNGLFICGDNGLYRIDGVTGARTQILAQPLGSRSHGIVSPIGMFFAGFDGQLWVTQGTPATTRSVVLGGVPPWDVQPIAWINGFIYFFAKDANQRYEVWRSDGSAASTVAVTSLSSMVQTSSPFRSAYELNGKIYFFNVPTNSLQVFDPAIGSVAPMFPAGSVSFVGRDLHGPFGGGLLVSTSLSTGQRDLSIFTGDPAATIQLTNDGSGHAIGGIAVAGPYVYFLRDESSSMYRKIYRATNAALSAVQIGGEATWLGQTGVAALYAVGNDIYFEATRPGFGGEPYKSSAPATTISLVRDIVPGAGASQPIDFVEFGGTTYFAAHTPSTWDQVWSTDGTSSGTRMVSDAISPFPPFEFSDAKDAGGLLFFKRPGGGSIVRSDGTPDGTWNIGDLNDQSQLDAAELNDKLILSVKAGVQSTWAAATDGTSAGTQLLVDPVPTSLWAPRGYSRVGNKVFFVASQLVGTNTTGEELGVTDGTPVGTFMVKDLAPGTDPSYPTQITDLNGVAIFVAYGTSGDGIYRSDGTTEGTVLLKNIRPGSAAYPRGLVAAGPYVYFTADDGIHGRELWRTDGTAAGTVLVRDIIPGPLSSAPDQLRSVDGRVYFVAATPETGLELWTSDGSANGTIMLFESVYGPESAAIQKLTPAGDRLYFLATTAPVGTSLWSFDRAGGLSLHCIADYDRSGGIAPDDIFAFLNDWFVSWPRADANANGTVEIQDIFEFLNSWFIGCS